jgi:GT2 family glycosyltransferase
VVVSYNSEIFTRLCLESVLTDPDDELLEVIVVDNGSDDGSLEYLLELGERDTSVKVIANSDNVGFPAACNQGLAVARGNSVVLLNSDTMVAPGWLARLLAHLDEDEASLVGPVTNRIGNEAEVAVEYETWGGFLREARRRADRLRGRSFEIPTLTMFCLAMRRKVHRRLGPLDAEFGVGTLEDDDYSARSRREGLRLRCAEDVLVHHFGEASFGKLFADGEYSRVLSRNRARFGRKWGEPWQSYGRRPNPAYDTLVERVRELVTGAVPPGSTVLLASKGDERLVELEDVNGWHFPRAPDGVWAGHYPRDSDEAIYQLEELQAQGAGYIAFPRTSSWWLEHYEGFASHLEGAHKLIAREDACVLYQLLPEQRDERKVAVSAASERPA